MPDARTRDLDNLCKAILDSLAHAGAYGDDSDIKLLIVETVRTEKPGWCEVTIGRKPDVAEQKNLFETGW